MPGVQPTLNAVGILWMTWLAWQLFSSPLDDLNPKPDTPRLRLWGAASLQLINPKTWMMALAVASVFVDAGSTQRANEVTRLALVFLLIVLPCLGCWALLGSGARRMSKSPVVLRRVNQGLGLVLLLLISAWASLWQ